MIIFIINMILKSIGILFIFSALTKDLNLLNKVILFFIGLIFIGIKIKKYKNRQKR